MTTFRSSGARGPGMWQFSTFLCLLVLLICPGLGLSRAPYQQPRLLRPRLLANRLRTLRLPISKFSR